jgi:hypothetical protein
VSTLMRSLTGLFGLVKPAQYVRIVMSCLRSSFSCVI